MRSAAFIVAAMAAFAAQAFDLDAWNGKCGRIEALSSEMRSLYAKYAAEAVDPALDLSIPVETYPAGSIKTLLSADKARVIFGSNYVWGEGVTICQFAESGATQSVVRAKNCLVNRVEKVGWIEGRAEADHGGAHLEGDGVYISLDGFFAGITSNALVRVRDVKLGDVESAEVTLSGTRAAYDRSEGVVMFEGDVRLAEGERRLGCERAFAFLAGTNDLKRVVALGNVRFSDSSRSGGCPRAVYLRSAERLEMHSSEGQPAFIEENGENKWRLEGRKIVFWPKTEQVEVDSATIVADTSKLDAKILEGGAL